MADQIPPLPPSAAMSIAAGFPEPAAAPAQVVRTRKHTSLQPWMVARAEAAFAEVLTKDAVARVLGISPRTMTRWLSEAAEESCTDELLLSFAAACDRGRNSATNEVMAALKSHMFESDKVALKMMEMLNPEWNTAKKVDVVATVDVKPKVDLALVATLEELELMSAAEEKRAELEKRMGSR